MLPNTLKVKISSEKLKGTVRMCAEKDLRYFQCPRSQK